MKRHEPSPEGRRAVAEAAGYGLPQAQVAALLGVDEKTLRLHYRQELDAGMAEANLAVARSLFRQATEGGNVTAAIWWTKARMRWAAPPREELVKLATAPSIPSWSQLAPALVALAGDNSPDALAGILQRLERSEGGAW